MSSNRSLIVAIVAVVVAGCTTNTVQLDYAAGNIEAAKYTDVRPIDTVIVFDYRKNDPHWPAAQGMLVVILLRSHPSDDKLRRRELGGAAPHG